MILAVVSKQFHFRALYNWVVVEICGYLTVTRKSLQSPTSICRRPQDVFFGQTGPAFSPTKSTVSKVTWQLQFEQFWGEKTSMYTPVI